MQPFTFRPLGQGFAKVYGPDWTNWRDPELLNPFNPTARLLDRHADSAVSDKPALIADGTYVSYRMLRDVVCQASQALTRSGIEINQRVLFFGTDSLEYLSAWLGAIRAGIVPVVISDLFKAHNLEYFLQDLEASGLFIDAENVPKLLEIKSTLPKSLSHVFVRGRHAGGLIQVPMSNWNDLLAQQSTTFEAVLRNCDDICYMFYSGGTTGTPKGICHLARDFELVPSRHGAYWHYEKDDVVYATSKKYFTHGLWPGVLIPLYHGATSVIHREPASPDRVLDTLERYQVTKWITVPTAIKGVLARWGSESGAINLPALKMAVSASEKMPPELFERFHQVFGLEVLDSIGSSEITYEWIANRPEEFKRGSLGKPVFGCDVRLVSPDGQEIDRPYEPGEAWVKSATSPLFYWRKFEKSQETFIGSWTRTKDSLYFDDEGFFWFAGRVDDLFKVHGLWVSPVEVEAAVTEHPAVLEAAVTPWETSQGTEVKVWVVLRPGYTPSDDLTQQICKNVRKIGGYKVPNQCEYLEQLPRTPLLKIDRRALRHLAEDGS